MRRTLLIGFITVLVFGTVGEAQQPATPPSSSSATAVVLAEPGFPAVDSAVALQSELSPALLNARFVNAEQLSGALAAPEARLLVVSGSAFPEQAWPAIYGFLQRGGNLLALGGRPFAQAAYRDGGKWALRPERNAFAKKLFINDYTETPGSSGLQFEANQDYSQLAIPKFDWTRAWSLVVKLSGQDMYPRGGSTGSLDTTFHALAWGSADGHRLSAPVVELDHFQNNFVGGRWEDCSCGSGSRVFRIFRRAEAGVRPGSACARRRRGLQRASALGAVFAGRAA